MVSTRVLLSILLSLLFSSGHSFGKDLPNIVLIVADDLGWGDVSLHGGEIKTPNIDRLATEGILMDRFYVAPVCTPTRAGLMTGRYPIRYGLMRTVLPPWREGGLDTEEVTLPEVLARAGYTHRGIFGKWHLGHSSINYHPQRRGFTEFLGQYNGYVDYFTRLREGELDWHDGYAPSYQDGYSTDLTSQRAIQFIRKRAKGKAPFFCYVPFNAPHLPFQAKEEDARLYEHLEALPGVWKEEPSTREKKRRILGGMITALDREIGRILETIDETGTRDNTLVLFFSDNGGVGGIGDNRPSRGAKGTVFEGGIRVPAAARWPGVIPGGRVVTTPLAYIDVLPTLMRIVGVTNHRGKPLDGIDMLDILTGEKKALSRDIYCYTGPQGDPYEQLTLITPEWKLVVLGPNVLDPDADDTKRSKLLFKINQDQEERNNVATTHPEVVDRMLEQVKAFRALQPPGAVSPYQEGREGFKAPKEWSFPDL